MTPGKPNLYNVSLLKNLDDLLRKYFEINVVYIGKATEIEPNAKYFCLFNEDNPEILNPNNIVENIRKIMDQYIPNRKN